ncbi:uncharacterized protein LOC112050948 [Bicyclus anynana]|uniref:Uncharacterized protein LOC112050948 n=1 Tax=Bicyclus anynana TaxID=110368 RepID=A0ABM3M363_BICAN|nr:uncharacterized protein LOC112050948 [Bicyclus anynana]
MSSRKTMGASYSSFSSPKNGAELNTHKTEEQIMQESKLEAKNKLKKIHRQIGQLEKRKTKLTKVLKVKKNRTRKITVSVQDFGSTSRVRSHLEVAQVTTNEMVSPSDNVQIQLAQSTETNMTNKVINNNEQPTEICSTTKFVKRVSFAGENTFSRTQVDKSVLELPCTNSAQLVRDTQNFNSETNTASTTQKELCGLTEKIRKEPNTDKTMLNYSSAYNDYLCGATSKPKKAGLVNERPVIREQGRHIQFTQSLDLQDAKQKKKRRTAVTNRSTVNQSLYQRESALRRSGHVYKPSVNIPAMTYRKPILKHKPTLNKPTPHTITNCAAPSHEQMLAEPTISSAESRNISHIQRYFDKLEQCPAPGSSLVNLTHFTSKLRTYITALELLNVKHVSEGDIMKLVCSKLEPYLLSNWCIYAQKHSKKDVPIIKTMLEFLTVQVDVGLKYLYPYTAEMLKTERQICKHK